MLYALSGRRALVALTSDSLDPSSINSRGVVVVALGVVTTVVLLAVVPKGAPDGGARYAVGASGASTLPVPSTEPTGSNTTRGSTTQTTSKTTAPTTTTFPVAQRPVLKLGSTGPDVVALQQRLTALGFNTGTADGSFGTGTQTAVMNFQKAKNMPADGIVGATTWAALATG
jgi:peptidoglycan hydrolase-like protein with peptidoglycan-binding domain